MNRFDERYNIEIASKSDTEEIMQYIDQVWKKKHILSQNKELFLYEFGEGDQLHFVLARDHVHNDAIAGCLGYYLCSHDEKIKDVWGTIWSVRNDWDNIPFLGIELFKRLNILLGNRSEIGVGVNEKTAIPLLKRVLKNKVGKLDHYYLLNDLPEYMVAQVNEYHIERQCSVEKGEYCIRPIHERQELEKRFDYKKYKNQIPYKDLEYVNKRFFEHPVYEYQVYGVYNRTNNIEAVIVLRQIQVQDRKVIRIVDYIGDKKVIGNTGAFFKSLLRANVEYVDFYCYGFQQEFLEQAGFHKRDDQDKNIIPNYFEPFLQKNVELWFNSTVKDVTICKADADQDRPNII